MAIKCCPRCGYVGERLAWNFSFSQEKRLGKNVAHLCCPSIKNAKGEFISLQNSDSLITVCDFEDKNDLVLVGIEAFI